MTPDSLPFVYHLSEKASPGAELIGLRGSLRQAWPRVWPLLVIGLILRLLFLLVGAKVYYGGHQLDIYTNGDSYSYVLSFRNLLEHGRYTFDLTEPDAAVGRLPGYPFFYGLHYLVFGSERVLPAMALTQLLLDTLGIWLIYSITAKLAPAQSWAPLIAALLLTFYPFSIVWIPVTGTETLGLFLVLLWWAVLVLARPRMSTWLLLGALLAVIVYVREFLGVCLGVTLFYLLLRSSRKQTVVGRLRPATLVTTGFLLLFIWWPVRNYLTLGRFIPLKPAAAGYANLREDMQAALAWVLTWTNDTSLGIDEILFVDKPVFPAHVISTHAEQQLIDSLIVMSRSCASSFHVRAQLRNPTPGAGSENQSVDAQRYFQPQRVNTMRHNNCNAVVSQGFRRLRASYVKRHPVLARVEVPLQNFQKILFKSQLQASRNGQISLTQRLVTLLFGWRSLLLGIGLIGAWRYRKQTDLWPAMLFAVFIYCYMAIVFRSLEMRYLLQADVLLLVPAALLLAGWLPQRRVELESAAVTEL